MYLSFAQHTLMFLLQHLGPRLAASFDLACVPLNRFFEPVLYTAAGELPVCKLEATEGKGCMLDFFVAHLLSGAVDDDLDAFYPLILEPRVEDITDAVCAVAQRIGPVSSFPGQLLESDNEHKVFRVESDETLVRAQLMLELLLSALDVNLRIGKVVVGTIHKRFDVDLDSAHVVYIPREVLGDDLVDAEETDIAVSLVYVHASDNPWAVSLHNVSAKAKVFDDEVTAIRI